MHVFLYVHFHESWRLFRWDIVPLLRELVQALCMLATLGREWVKRRNNESIMDGSEGRIPFSLKLPGEWELWPYE